MNPVYRTFTIEAPGPQDPVSFDSYKAPATATVAIWVQGQARYAVEGSLCDPNDPSANPRWYLIPGSTYWSTTSQLFPITTPFRFIRLNLDFYSAPVEFKFVQGTAINTNGF